MRIQNSDILHSRISFKSRWDYCFSTVIVGSNVRLHSMSLLESITAGFQLAFRYVDSFQGWFEISDWVVLLNILVHHVLRYGRYSFFLSFLSFFLSLFLSLKLRITLLTLHWTVRCRRLMNVKPDEAYVSCCTGFVWNEYTGWLMSENDLDISLSERNDCTYLNIIVTHWTWSSYLKIYSIRILKKSSYSLQHLLLSVDSVSRRARDRWRALVNAVMNLRFP